MPTILEHQIFCYCESCHEFTIAVPNRNGTGYELSKESEHIGCKVNFDKTIPSAVLGQQYLNQLELQIITHKFGKKNKVFDNWNAIPPPGRKKKIWTK